MRFEWVIAWNLNLLLPHMYYHCPVPWRRVLRMAFWGFGGEGRVRGKKKRRGGFKPGIVAMGKGEVYWRATILFLFLFFHLCSSFHHVICCVSFAWRRCFVILPRVAWMNRKSKLGSVMLTEKMKEEEKKEDAMLGGMCNLWCLLMLLGGVNWPLELQPLFVCGGDA